MASRESDEFGEDERADDTSRWQRFTGSVSNFALKPAVAAESGTGNAKPSGIDHLNTQDELEAAIKRSNDKERLVGLLVSPVAAAIGFVVTAVLVANDPKLPSTRHVNPTLYTELGLLTMALSLAMLGLAWYRKRTFFGIAAAMYGLSMFNLHYWGFGIPYILIGSWFLVRSYRLSEKLKKVKADGAPQYRPTGAKPLPSKRYTPPVAQPRRTSRPKPAIGSETG